MTTPKPLTGAELAAKHGFAPLSDEAHRRNVESEAGQSAKTSIVTIEGRQNVSGDALPYIILADVVMSKDGSSKVESCGCGLAWSKHTSSMKTRARLTRYAGCALSALRAILTASIDEEFAAIVAANRARPKSVTLTLPIKTRNTANSSQGISRAGMFARAREKKAIKGAVLLAVRPRVAGFVGPFAVHVVRLAPSKGLDKHDGLPMSQKWVIDAVAEALGVDDSVLEVTYDQLRTKTYGVTISIREVR